MRLTTAATVVTKTAVILKISVGTTAGVVSTNVTGTTTKRSTIASTNITVINSANEKLSSGIVRHSIVDAKKNKIAEKMNVLVKNSGMISIRVMNAFNSTAGYASSFRKPW